ncbi:MAG: Heparinase family protein [Gammaproteobacteria bacterium]|nr:Heparinase family protein [Gammaproteobacteria bacterium]
MVTSSRYARLHWTLSRLKAMSPLEMGFRLNRKIQGTVERAGIGLARPAPPVGQCGKPWLARLPRDFAAERYTRAADRILDGFFSIFALHDAQLGFPPRWNADPRTGIEAPLVFGKDLNYRDAALVGDVKYLWEPNRHLELVTLAQAWHLTGDERYAFGCRVLLDSWFRQCPYPMGVNWCVSLEHALRLVNWSFAWWLLGSSESVLFTGAAGQAFRLRWLTCIYQHCHFIDRHWSRHSSANNHLFGEATGLFVGAMTWPLWRESEGWGRRARAELAREGLAQTYEDGVNKEQAIWYHHAVADMMLVAGLVARANACDFSGEYWRRLEAMLEFIASIMDVNGNVPAIGDADEGVLVRFVPEGEPRVLPAGGTDVFRSLLATGAVLFARPEFRVKARSFDEKSRWLLGDEAAASFDALDGSRALLPPRRAFSDGGYFVLGDALETSREVRVVADAGPLGYLAIAAHGHADALAFTLSVAGEPILVDPGTFSYSAMPWRHYFRGTSAHNTVVVDGKDQSEYGGSFLWLEHTKTIVDAFDLSADTQVLTAHHEGYRRLSDPVRHRRTWSYGTGSSRLTITDELLCAGAHEVAIYWHFASECEVVQRGSQVIAQRAAVRVTLTCPDGLTTRLAVGNEKPPLGWVSNGFDAKLPTTTAVFTGEIRGAASFRSEIVIEQSG